MHAMELNEEGQALMATYERHLRGPHACNCDVCCTARRIRVAEPPRRPSCCGKEMQWQGDPCNGPLGYECLTCGKNGQG